jgi:polysaccharide chain length determinant protein (PEP-CTERM system associated)
MEFEVKTAQDFLDILKRRRWSIIAPAGVVFILAAIVAFCWPPTYRSTATILIEEQEVPREYVNTAVTTFADQRLQEINQRIMGTTKLLEIITKFKLYDDLKSKWTTEEIVDKMRKDIKFNTVSADVIDPRSGQPRPATIAFTLSYNGKNPAVVQQVASELTTLYLEENLKNREEQAQGTSKFLENEMNSVQAQLANFDNQIKTYKQGHINSLPELTQLNLQSLDTLEREIVSLSYQLRTLKEKESDIQSQLSTIPTDAGNQDKTRLSELRVKLGEMKTRLTDEHPDVIKTKSEIAELVKQLRASGRDSADNKPDNPAYITLSSQLAGIQSEIGSTKRQIDTLSRKRDDYKNRIAASPGVEEGYKNILLQRNNLQLKYDDLSKKFMEAKVSSGMEKAQKGDRFTLIDAARLPEKPVSPNIPAILLIGLVLGLGCGVGVAALNEQGDQTARTPEMLARVTSFPVLAGIPEIVTWEDIAREKVKRRRTIICVLLVLVITPVLFNFLVMDLDVFWAKALRKMARF